MRNTTMVVMLASMMGAQAYAATSIPQVAGRPVEVARSPMLPAKTAFTCGPWQGVEKKTLKNADILFSPSDKAYYVYVEWKAPAAAAPPIREKLLKRRASKKDVWESTTFVVTFLHSGLPGGKIEKAVIEIADRPETHIGVGGKVSTRPGATCKPVASTES